MKSIKNTDSLISAVRNYLGGQNFEKGAHILSAFSGGPDSTALALALIFLKEEFGFTLELGHYDHGIRSAEESERERDFVRRFAERFAVPIHMGKAEPGAIEDYARNTRKSLEDAAREYRYGFLQKTGASASLGYIALGHTREDRMETQIFRFFQGSSFSTLDGIRERRGNFIRPLIYLDKKEILQFLADRKETYCIDSSNTSVRFLRNKVRLKLVPLLEEIFPGYPSALDKLTVKAKLNRDFIERSLAENNPWQKGPLGWECDLRRFLDLHPLLRIHSVYGLFNQELPSGKEKRIPFTFFLPLKEDGNFFRAGTLLKGHGSRLEIAGNKLFWKTDIVLEQKKGYLYVIDGPVNFDVAGRLRIRVEVPLTGSDSAEDVFPCGEEGFLILRSRRQGDVMLTGGGHKTLKKLLQDIKIPEGMRNTVPVLQNSREIIGLLLRPYGVKTVRIPDLKNRKSGTTKYLRLIIERIGEDSG
jgi:tRNA(Ile)-lysidine synthase